MPFTPFHFVPSACVSLPLHRYLDVPIFIGANVVVDFEPLIVMKCGLDYPVHGYCHTLPIGGLIGCVLGILAYPCRNLIGSAMSMIRLPYSPALGKMVLSGMLGVWLHVLFDSVLYIDIRPLYPFNMNPVLGLLSSQTVYLICAVCFAPALVLYFFQAFEWGERNIEDG